MSRTAQSKFNKVIIAVVAVLVLAGAGLGIKHQLDKNNQSSQQAQTTAATSPAKTEPTTNLTYKGETGKNALELLKQNAKVVTKTSAGLGEYVVSINGNDGGGKKYWLYYVNGEEAQVGAGSYQTKNSDTIEWKLQ